MRQTVIADSTGKVLWTSYIWPELKESQVIGSNISDWYEYPARDRVMATASYAFFTGKPQRLRSSHTVGGRVVDLDVEYYRVSDLLVIVWTLATDVTFTRREQQVFDAICNGHGPSAIANDLKIALSTVEAHRAALLRKTGTSNSVGLARWAIRHGFIVP